VVLHVSGTLSEGVFLYSSRCLNIKIGYEIHDNFFFLIRCYFKWFSAGRVSVCPLRLYEQQ